MTKLTANNKHTDKDNRKYEEINQRIVAKLVEREVGECVSMLVHHVSKHPDALEGSDYTWEKDILPLCVQDDWEETWKYHRLHGVVTAKDADRPDDYQEACFALGINDPHQNEAYEHWIVSDWFADRLAQQGEMVGDLFNLSIWGRTATGQAIFLDGVIKNIAQELGILSGQHNEWKV